MSSTIAVSVGVRVRLLARTSVLTLLTFVSAGALSDDGLRLQEAWIRLLPGDLPLGGYFTLTNDGKAPVRLVGAESDAFEGIMMHESIQEGGSARMQHVNAVEVLPGDTLRFAPGGYHLMLMKRRGPVNLGDRLPITLMFEDGRQVTAEFTVRHPASD
jgi:copper(I)-binding protein